jgi:hypothetical protein
MRCPSSRPRAAYESFSLANMSAARMRRASIAARARRGRTASFVPLLDAAFVDVVFKVAFVDVVLARERLSDKSCTASSLKTKRLGEEGNPSQRRPLGTRPEVR